MLLRPLFYDIRLTGQRLNVCREAILSQSDAMGCWTELRVVLEFRAILRQMVDRITTLQVSDARPAYREDVRHLRATFTEQRSTIFCMS